MRNMERPEFGESPAVAPRPSAVPANSRLPRVPRIRLWLACALALTLSTPSLARSKKNESYGLGLSVVIPASQDQVAQAVEDLVQDGIIQGSKEYNKDQYIENAAAAQSSRLFLPSAEPGKVFYKVREHVLAPLNFKESEDLGTLAVRYIVHAEAPNQTLLRIDAVFAEEFRRTVHPSNGSVEAAESKAIQDRIDAFQLKKRQATEVERLQREELSRQILARSPERDDDASPRHRPTTASETLEQHVQDLRRQVERIVKAPGAALKTAPFYSASTAASLTTGARVAILIVTPYWYGVETEAGQHGWIRSDQLEPAP